MLTEADEAVQVRPNPSIRRPEDRTAESVSERICRAIFRILLAQLIFIAIWSLVAQTGPIFVQRFFFGLDFADFYRAGSDWLNGVNPYLRERFFTPPPSLLVGTVFAGIPFDIAKIVFFALNLGIILISVRAVAQKLGLSHRCRDYLTGIAFLFYPVYFLVERGNLEGLVLGCLCWAFCTKHETARGVLVGLAGGLKLYPLLLLAASVRKRDWRFQLTALITFSLLMWAFYPLLHLFVSSVRQRGFVYHEVENISPAAIILLLCGKLYGGWIFIACWIGTLVPTLVRAIESNEDCPILLFLPWMVAFPAQVFPYGGVLLLPVLAWKLSRMERSGVRLQDKVFLLGFLLVAVQAWALTGYFPKLTSPHPVFHLANSLGMCLILGSLAMPKILAGRRRLAPAYV